MTTHILRLMNLAFLVLALMLPAGCPDRTGGRTPETNEPAHVRLAQEFKLHVEQRATVDGEPFSLRFVSVVNDSRCPADVTCVWAGNAEVLIEANAGGSIASLKLNTLGGDKFPKDARHQHYTVGLVGLSPLPRKVSRIKTTEYEATLVIRKE